MARIHEIRIHIEHATGFSDSLLIYGENPESVKVVADQVNSALRFSPRICSPLGGQIRVGKSICTYYSAGIRISGDIAALLRHIISAWGDVGHYMYFSVRDALEDPSWKTLEKAWSVRVANACCGMFVRTADNAWLEARHLPGPRLNMRLAVLGENGVHQYTSEIQVFPSSRNIIYALEHFDVIAGARVYAPSHLFVLASNNLPPLVVRDVTDLLAVYAAR